MKQKSHQADHNSVFFIGTSNKLPTLKVFPTYQASIDVDVGERDGAKFLKVEIQHAPDAHTAAGMRKRKTLILAIV